MGLMFMLTIAVIIAAVGALPIWHHSKSWGYYPIGGVSVVILIILFLAARAIVGQGNSTKERVKLG
jgi:bacteriorhodopsin